MKMVFFFILHRVEGSCGTIPIAPLSLRNSSFILYLPSDSGTGVIFVIATLEIR